MTALKKSKTTPRSLSLDVDTIIGENVRFIRQSKGLSQQQLGKEIGRTFQQIQKYERGTNRIASSTLYNMSKVLDVKIADFFKGVELVHKEFSSTITRNDFEIARSISLLPPASKLVVKNLIKSLSEKAGS